MSLGICTLYNLGNTCYINSMIQILLHTSELNNILIQTPNVINTLENLVVHHWKELLHKTCISSNICKISPHGLIGSIRKYNKQWDHSQHDASEFLIELLDIFNISISRPVNIKIVDNYNNVENQIYLECYKRIQQLYSSNYSDMISIFNGMLITEITDLNKTHISRTFDPYFILQLSIPTHNNDNNTITTIYNCLNLLWSPELLTDYKVSDVSDGWGGERLYQNNITVTKTYYLWITPQILILNLKRYTDTDTKINTYVDIPHHLNLSKYLYKNCTAIPHYQLYAICNHVGNMDNGHYYSYVFVSQINKWIVFNDDLSPQIIPENKVSTQHAVCVFYKKIKLPG